jgi:GMP synthase (glutamine-hydrolysing)
MARVLIVDNCIEPLVYGPVQHWGRHLACSPESVRPPAGGFPKDLRAYTHIILSGSEATILDDSEWILRECDLVAEAARLGIPILASCFAHQLVVRALSGKQHVRRSPTPEFGWVEVVATPQAAHDPVFGWIRERVHTYSAHFDEVQPLPAGWVRLAKSGRCGNAVIAWEKGPIWGIQHHPEINPDEGSALLLALLEKRPERRDAMLSGYSADVRDSGIVGEVVRRFLQT